MKLDQEDIQSFKRLWEKNFQENIDDAVAETEANHLINMLKETFQSFEIIEDSQIQTQLSII